QQGNAPELPGQLLERARHSRRTRLSVAPSRGDRARALALARPLARAATRPRGDDLSDCLARRRGHGAPLGVAVFCVGVGGRHGAVSRAPARVGGPAPAIGWAVVVVLVLAGIV